MQSSSNYPPIDDLHLVALHFKPEQLTRARELRGYTKVELAHKIGKTPAAITQFEKGQTKPDVETLARIVWHLEMPRSFFSRNPIARSIDVNECHFRTLRAVSQNRRRQAVRTGELLHEVYCLLEKAGILFPVERLSQLKRVVHCEEDIEKAALDTRQRWGLGLGPIPGVLSLLESQGLRLLPLGEVCQEVDAFSMWHEEHPFIMLAMQKSASRTHFDAMHEVGHLILHEDVLPGAPQEEREADRFASAFLLPRSPFLSECPTYWNLEIFRALKRRWHVSIQALVYRAHKLGKLSISSYRRAFTEINQRGLRQNEPDEWQLEKPTALKTALYLVQSDCSLNVLANQLGVQERYLTSLLNPISG